MPAVSEEQVGAVGRLLINTARPLKERFRALFTLKNIGGPLALDWIIKVPMLPLIFLITVIIGDDP
jgi:deoxyhypusine monooxygenase